MTLQPKASMGIAIKLAKAHQNVAQKQYRVYTMDFLNKQGGAEELLLTQMNHELPFQIPVLAIPNVAGFSGPSVFHF